MILQLLVIGVVGKEGISYDTGIRAGDLDGRCSQFLRQRMLEEKPFGKKKSLSQILFLNFNVRFIEV